MVNGQCGISEFFIDHFYLGLWALEHFSTFVGAMHYNLFCSNLPAGKGRGSNPALDAGSFLSPTVSRTILSGAFGQIFFFLASIDG